MSPSVSAPVPPSAQAYRLQLAVPLLAVLATSLVALVHPYAVPPADRRWMLHPLLTLGLLLYGVGVGGLFARRALRTTGPDFATNGLIAMATVTGPAMFGAVQLLLYRATPGLAVTLPVCLVLYALVARRASAALAA